MHCSTSDTENTCFSVVVCVLDTVPLNPSQLMGKLLDFFSVFLKDFTQERLSSASHDTSISGSIAVEDDDISVLQTV